MSQRVSIHEAAEAEINDAADFYDIGAGLGRLFLDEVERAIGWIAEFPEAALLLARASLTAVQQARFSHLLRDRSQPGHRDDPV